MNKGENKVIEKLSTGCEHGVAIWISVCWKIHRVIDIIELVFYV